MMLAPTPTPTPAINPPGNARLCALRAALDGLQITDTLGAGLDQLHAMQAGLRRTKRWIDLEIEDRTYDPHREGTE